VLQLDCPDLAMSGHMLGESLDDFRARARLNVEAIGHATRDIPPTTYDCTCAGATTRARTTVMWRWATSSTW